MDYLGGLWDCWLKARTAIFIACWCRKCSNWMAGNCWFFVANAHISERKHMRNMRSISKQEKLEENIAFVLFQIICIIMNTHIGLRPPYQLHLAEEEDGSNFYILFGQNFTWLAIHTHDSYNQIVCIWLPADSVPPPLLPQIGVEYVGVWYAYAMDLYGNNTTWYWTFRMDIA